MRARASHGASCAPSSPHAAARSSSFAVAERRRRSSRAAVYQATWVRQGDAELVLVAPASGDLGGADEPPSRDLRLAVDRVFMGPLRRALERAPRASRPTFPASRVASERRA